MKIVYSRRARAQLEVIHQYIHERNEEAATVVVAHIRNNINLLSDWPELGRIADEKDVRALAISRFPFIVFYLIRKRSVIILSIMHTAQDQL